MTKEELLIDLIAAYKDARKRIRNRGYQLAFEQDLERELVVLCDELWAQEWYPGPADAFIVSYPVQREVFASQFRDRIVHHLLYNYIAPLMDRVFIRDSFSCRKGKGTSDAVNRLKHHLQSATDCYKRPAFILKMDIMGYFMSIDHMKLEAVIRRHLDRHWKRPQDRAFIDYLVHTIIFNDVTADCRFRGKKSDWNGLPSCKSLFNRKVGQGLPIGDLTSQLFSNIYLNELDQYVKRDLKCRHYGRYVDDFFFIDSDREKLMTIRDEVTRFLSEMLGLSVNVRKTLLQPADWPFSFLGQRIHPYFSTPTGRVIHKFKRTVGRVKKDFCGIESLMPFDGEMNEELYRSLYVVGDEYIWHRAVNAHTVVINRDLSVLNSYLGYLNHIKTYHLVNNVFFSSGESSLNKCFCFETDMKKVKLNNWYKHKYLMA